MSAALRLCIQDRGKQSRGREPLACLYRHAHKLDRICRKLELRQLSDFHDHSAGGSDATGEKIPGRVTDTIKIVMTSRPWFSAADGLATLAPLLRWLEQNPTRFGLVSNDYPDVLNELRLCVEGLEAHPDEACQFNLCVVSPGR